MYGKKLFNSISTQVIQYYELHRSSMIELQHSVHELVVVDHEIVSREGQTVTESKSNDTYVVHTQLTHN